MGARLVGGMGLVFQHGVWQMKAVESLRQSMPAPGARWTVVPQGHAPQRPW